VALAECRRYPLLPQALVARSALEAAGLHPIVFDFWRASVFWTEQFTLNGIRVMVPEQELEAAQQLLAQVDPVRPPAKSAGPLRPPNLLLWVLMAACIFIGWPIAGFRRPTRFHQVSALILTLVGLGIVALELSNSWMR
jgi:hypothetical protein